MMPFDCNRESPVKPLRLRVGDGREATRAGCGLAALVGALTVAVCLVFGPTVVVWVTPAVPWVGRRVATVLVCLALVWPGLLVFWAGARFLNRRGIAVWREASEAAHHDSGRDR